VVKTGLIRTHIYRHGDRGYSLETANAGFLSMLLFFSPDEQVHGYPMYFAILFPAESR
jgi:hypothetical protein